jgi:hypothetical protein
MISISRPELVGCGEFEFDWLDWRWGMQFKKQTAMEDAMRCLRRMRIVAAAGGLMLALSHAGLAQLNNGQPTGPYGTQSTDPFGGQSNGKASGRGSQQQTPSLPSVVPPEPAPPPQFEKDQAKARNVDRQKQLVLDTQKLLALANELKMDVDKSTKDTLSLDVIRKAEEIEKLAHSVKEKMKGS